MSTTTINGVNYLTSGSTASVTGFIPASIPLNLIIPSSITIGITSYSVTSIISGSLQGAPITSLNISNSVTSIGSSAFSNCVALISATIGNSVTSIGNNAFYNCIKLASIVIPDSVVSIGELAFRFCRGMVSVTIGNSVTYISRLAFNGCNSLASITFNNQNNLLPTQGENVFGGSSNIMLVNFYNTGNLSELTVGAQNLKAQIDAASAPRTVNYFYFLPDPTLSNFSILNQTFGDAPFQITDPSSNSSGAFTYTSSNTNVATISGNMITIVGGGTSTITAIQAATSSYSSGSIDASFQVFQATTLITYFSIPTKTTVDVPFPIPPPTSNSDGSFTYLSSEPAVATISGNIITIRGVGTSTITANQAATSNYTSGTTDTTFQVTLPPPTLTSFSIPSKFVGDSPFQITPPTSNSSGAFTYTSSNTDVATIYGNIITLVGPPGNSLITATQAATSDYDPGSIVSNFVVIEPIIINNSSQLLDFMNSTDPNEFYGVITTSITIDSDLTSLAQKILMASNANVQITKIVVG